MIKGKKRCYQFKLYLHQRALLIQILSKASVFPINFLSKLIEVLINKLPLPCLCSDRPSLAELCCCAAEQKETMGARVREEGQYSSSQTWSERGRGCWALLLELVENFTLSEHWKESRNKLERKCLSLPSFTEEFSVALKYRTCLSLGPQILNLLLNSILLRDKEHSLFPSLLRPDDSSLFHC